MVKQQICDPIKLASGHYVSELQFYRVHQHNVHGGIELENERGFKFTVSKSIISEGYYSADQYDKEESVTRTELIEIFSRCWGAVFTVEFKKQPKQTEINKVIASMQGETVAKQKKAIKEAMSGEHRKMVGYLTSTETGFGRSMCIDLKKEKGNGKWDGRIVQVDHRSIESLIFKNVKYVVRKHK